MRVRIHLHMIAVAISIGVVPAAAAAQGGPSPQPTASSVASNDPCSSLSSVVSRPTFSTAACVVKPGDLLIESGYTNVVTSGAAASRAVAFPQTAMRVGLGHRIEFDLGPPSMAYRSGPGRQVGISDGSIGLADELGYSRRFVYGVNALFTLPVGSANVFSSNGNGILADLNGTFALSPAFGLFGTLGYNAQSAGTPANPLRYHDYQPSLGATVTLPLQSDVFIEGFDQSATGPGQGGRFGYDTGVQKDIGMRLQLDLNYFDYLGVQSGGHQHAIGFGAAYLIGS